ncbi:MAG: cytochrome c [Nitrospinota bacterium]|nr:MAG: cytochrome c [Nitrospinota bacterium]
MLRKKGGWFMQRWSIGVLTLIAFTLLLFPLSVQAQSDEAFIIYRQKLMRANGAHMGAIADILKKKLPYTDHIATHAQGIHLVSKLIADAFKKEITAGKTDAKPEIWQDWEKFTAAADAMGKESARLAEIAQSGDMQAIVAQVKKLGGTCGDCHKPFRKPKEESYKRQQ